MKTMEEAEREAHGYWFDRAEKAERERDEAIKQRTEERVENLAEMDRLERERDEARAIIESVKVLVELGRAGGISDELADELEVTLKGEKNEV